MEDNRRRLAGALASAALAYIAKMESASCKIVPGEQIPSSPPLPQLPAADDDDMPSELCNSVSPTTPLDKDIMEYSTRPFLSSSSSLMDGEFRPLPSPPTKPQRPIDLVTKEGYKENRVAAVANMTTTKKHERVIEEEYEKEINTMNNKKKQKTTKKSMRSEVNETGKEKERAPAKTMPPHMLKLITKELQGKDINWINTKLIHASDIKKTQNRLLLPNPKEILEKVMTKDEITSVRDLKEHMEVHVFDPQLVVRKLSLSYWGTKTKKYSLIKRWSKLAAANGLKPRSHEVDIWSFRNQLDMLCFAVDFRRIRREEDDDDKLDPEELDTKEEVEEEPTGGAGICGVSMSGYGGCGGSTSGNA